MILEISVESVVIYFSFLILLIWVLSLFFFLMSLAKGLSILFFFSKNQLLVSLIFAVVILVSISFISALIFLYFFPSANFESEVAQSCPTLCDPMDCSLPRSSLHGILQARVLEWIAISFSRGSSRPRDWTQASCISGRRFNLWATRDFFFFL